MKKEKPYYYATTVENGEIINHDGDERFAVYLSEIEETSERSNLWHKWLSENVKDAHNSMGIINDDIMAKYGYICKQFLNGERTK